ncbi:hypothetical protein [Streptomyces sp. R08]|uniref:Integral membrane protein n=1 Tax=Streptomyces sp. R08 TaxID=3238624 RepID=A0AB39MBY3_9ACTN
MKSLLTTAKSFITNLLLWSSFITGLAASTASGALLDGTAKTAATFTGIAVSLLTGSRIAKKPRIKAFLSKPSTLWFLFLFNGGVAAFCYLSMDGVKGIATAAGMGLVSLGAAGGLLTARRTPTAKTAAQEPWA